MDLKIILIFVLAAVVAMLIAYVAVLSSPTPIFGTTATCPPQVSNWWSQQCYAH